MTGLVDDYIPLGRTFRELELDSGTEDDDGLSQLWGHHESLKWPALLSEHRVILLSEAGAGKTAEIRNTAQTLQKQGKPAFFIRIENIQHNFEDAFEVGGHAQFLEWCQSGEEGWLLLDSVDEARLRHPMDFELAIKKLGRLLKPVLSHTHIVITGRTTAWRAKTDLMLCQGNLPYQPATTIASTQPETEDQYITTKREVSQGDAATLFKIFALEDLHGDQITTFLLAKNVKDTKAFQSEVDRKDALFLTTRPQDLAELIEYWNTHLRIGSRFELMLNGIDRRLKERDQNRSEVYPITAKQLRKGAQLIAAATTLSQQSAIQVPDGTKNDKGIAVEDVLIDWDNVGCSTLLSRPIFDEGIYGTVRFHHRSVREYLTAEWLHELIKQDGSRERIERLLFRKQYDIEVIVPTMRPVLSWLALMDGRILSRLCRLAPEVIFEGGDPSRLPLETRCKILRQACEKQVQPAHGNTFSDFNSLKRFAAPDLYNEINALLDQYGEVEDIAWFLLLMIWHGEIAKSAEKAKHIAMVSRAKYTRVAAFRAMTIVGSKQDQKDVLRAMLKEDTEFDRHWIAEVVHWLTPDEECAEWILEIVKRVEPEPPYHADNLTRDLCEIVANWPLPLLTRLITELSELLSEPPVVEIYPGKLSERYGWLITPAAHTALSIIEARDMSAVQAPLLSVLSQILIIHEHGKFDLGDIKKAICERTLEWPEFNHRLFWHDVIQSRTALATQHGLQHRLSNFWQIGIFGHFWTMQTDSFDWLSDDIVNRELLDDKLVALTTAFFLYQENDRPSDWLIRLRQCTQPLAELAVTLDEMLTPSASELKKLKQREARWKRKAEEQAATRTEYHREWKEHLDSHVASLRTPPVPGEMTNDQYYLLRRMHEKPGNSNRWSEGSWQVLIPEFGEEIASAFRDGAVNYWRSYCPLLRSEGALPNSTPYSVIFGLLGLSIEAHENPVWCEKLTHSDVCVATRFALHELNGFPSWLPKLFMSHSQSVISVVIQEIDFELRTHVPEQMAGYVLEDISAGGEWIWDELAPLLLSRLQKTPRNMGQLRRILNIIKGSSLEDSVLASLASQHAKACEEMDIAPYWYSLWAGVDPSASISALAAHLAQMTGEEDKTHFAMIFITALMGSRRERACAREAYRTVEHMKALYLLMNLYIREQEDVQRANSGVYSPGLRDDAQDARTALLNFIRDTPGKPAYYALMEISNSHPVKTAQSWMAFQAKAKATMDADLSPWSPKQVREFNDRLERTPTNHRDLWDLAIDRLEALKHDLEDGDTSIASILQPRDQEVEIRNFIGDWCRERAGDRYKIPQEEEFADAKRADLRFHGSGFDGQVPIELKLADKWTGPKLFERLENQLCRQYLRDRRSKYGIFLLVYHGTKRSKRWKLPGGQDTEKFESLVEQLQRHWTTLSPQFPGIEDIIVMGIDLTKRGSHAKAPSTIEPCLATNESAQPG